MRWPKKPSELILDKSGMLVFKWNFNSCPKNALPQNRPSAPPPLATRPRHLLPQGQRAAAGVPVSEFDGALCSNGPPAGQKPTHALSSAWATRKRSSPTRSAALWRRHQAAAQTRRNEVALDLTAHADHVAPAVEGALLASYKFEGFGRDAAKKSRGVLAKCRSWSRNMS